MSTSNPIQPAIGAGEAQEVNNIASVARAEGAQPVSGEAAAPESAATAAVLELSADASDSDGEFSMEDFGKILAEHEQSHRSEISEGEVVKGRVVKISDQNVIIDVGFKSEGIVAISEFKDGEQITILAIHHAAASCRNRAVEPALRSVIDVLDTGLAVAQARPVIA